MENDIEIKNNDLKWLGLLFLCFFFPEGINIPEEFKEIYDKYSDKNGNIIDQERFMKESEPFIRDYYNKCKEEFYGNIQA
jgi:hypothetical protein